MSQRCPYCQAEQTDGSRTCAQCGTPAGMPLFTFAPLDSRAFAESTPRSAAPAVPSEPEVRRPEVRRPVVRGLSWKIPAALAVLAVAGLSLRPFQPHPAMKPPTPSPLATSSPAAPAALPVPSRPLPPPAAPLSIALRSSAAFPAAVMVGKAVTIMATATTIPGHPPTVTVFYQQDRGPELLMAQAQGTRCRVSWTPARPGEYSFTATAREDQARVAQATPLIFHIAAAPKLAGPQVILPSTMRVVLPRHILAVPRPPKTPRTAKPTVKIQVKNQVKTIGKLPMSPTRFHVAAAMLPFERGAAVLATALHQRGYPAVVRPRSNGAGNRRYVVQTGVFFSAAAARQQSQQLQHDGYPAFTYRAP